MGWFFWFYVFVQVSDRLWRELGFTLVCLIRFVFVTCCKLYFSHFANFICPNWILYLSHIANSICICAILQILFVTCCKLYLSHLPNYISRNQKLSLLKLKIVFVKIANYICTDKIYLNQNYIFQIPLNRLEHCQALPDKMVMDGWVRFLPYKLHL